MYGLVYCSILPGLASDDFGCLFFNYVSPFRCRKCSLLNRTPPNTDGLAPTYLHHRCLAAIELERHITMSNNYGCMNLFLDCFLVIITGGLWLIWIFVREMRR